MQHMLICSILICNWYITNCNCKKRSRVPRTLLPPFMWSGNVTGDRRCVVTESIHRRTCNCVLQHYMQNLKTTQLRLMNQKFYAHSSDFCFILAFKASICRSSACCLIFSCFSWSFFLFFSSSCCSANFFARIFSRISNGGSERTEMVQLSEVL